MDYVFLLKQHIGVASEPMVKEGDEVKRGELIAAKPKDQLGANVFSSVSGTVTAVKEDRIIVREEGTVFSEYEKLKSNSDLELIEEAGLVGLGGAGFPTYVKMKSVFRGEGTVLINAAECEPILSHNVERIQKEPEALVEALQMIMDILKAKRGIIGLKGVHKEAAEALRRVCKADGIRICELENIYPVGEERALIRDALGILLEPDKLPIAADAVVFNAETAYRIREAIKYKKPLIDKDLTVAGKLKENASIHVMYDIPLGKSVKDVIEAAGGIGDDYGELIMGGPFTGKRTDMDAPIQKTTGGIIVSENFMHGPEKIGLLVCACGADEARLKEQARSMGSEVVGVEYCKQAVQIKGSCKCENPGRCPGQVQKVMALKKAGAQAVLVSNCTDCTNTVMSCAPQLKLPVYHCTDGAMRSVNYKMIRKIKTV